LRHIANFGFDTSRLPENLSLALGSGTVTPLELAAGYAVLANGGFRVEPYFMERIERGGKEIIYAAQPPRVCDELCFEVRQLAQEQWLDDETTGDPDVPELAVPEQLAPRVLSAENAYQTVSMMQDVITRGTARRARALNRGDLAGKTGTTNDQKDAWFSGFNGDLVTTVWVGFDKLKPLGSRETGAVAALPMWMEFMGTALKGRPPNTLPQPEGMITVRIDAETGLLADADNERAIFETFRSDRIPARPAIDLTQRRGGSETQPAVQIPEQLF
jgi:penicillin-binding protein 1A